MLAHHQCPADEICDVGAWGDDCGGGWCYAVAGDASLSVCVMSCGSAGPFWPVSDYDHNNTSV